MTNIEDPFPSGPMQLAAMEALRRARESRQRYFTGILLRVSLGTATQADVESLAEELRVPSPFLTPTT